MPDIIIYTTDYCPYCISAKKLLDRKGQKYIEINLTSDPSKREEMLLKSKGARTVPQIFIDDFHVGGFDDMAELDRLGKLDDLFT